MQSNFQYKRNQKSNKHLHYAWFPAMHTQIDLILCHSSEERRERTASRIYDEIIALEKMASYFDKESELYRLNQCASIEPVAVSPELYYIIELSLKYNTKTFGCFDITVKSDCFDNNTIQQIQLTKDAQTVFFKCPNISIDLSGFLRGYALEKIRAILSAEGLKDAFINIGSSSILAVGNRPPETGWKINCRSGNSNEPPSTIYLQNECFSVSGNDTTEHRHIICPSTGEYVDGIGYVGIVTRNAIDGDVLSTALCVATMEQEQSILENFAIDQMILF